MIICQRAGGAVSARGQQPVSKRNNRWLSLDFYDLLAPFQAQPNFSNSERPRLLSRQLRYYATGAGGDGRRIDAKGQKSDFGAEVLEPQDRELLRNVFHNVGKFIRRQKAFSLPPAGVERYSQRRVCSH